MAALLSTDTAPSDEEIITTCKRRWGSEMFFKISQSFLNLAKECQIRSSDALVVRVHAVCCRSIMPAIAKRTNQAPRTLGTLFHACCEELEQVTFAEALALMLMLLKQVLANVPEMTSERIQSLAGIEPFLKELPPIYGARWLIDRQNGAVSC